jgi:uncharacterized membrane protein
MKSGCVHVVEVDTTCVGAMAAYFFLGGTLTSSVKMSSTKARAMARSSRIINWLKVCERYANHILWMAVWRIILTVWDSTRQKIWRGGVVLYRSR